MEHESSILLEPFNKYIWRHAFGVDVPDHVLMAGLVFVGLRDMMHDIIGHGSERFLEMIAAFTVFIFISNMFGLFYFLQPPTSNPNTTFALSIASFLYLNYQGIRTQGLWHYLGHFAGPVWWLAPLMFPIEIVANFARALSLGMRLFGN